MSKRNTWFVTAIITVIALTFTLGIPSGAQSVPGVTPTQILLGGTHPYSGPAAGYATIGKCALAYFSYVNDQGGVYGRKIVYEDKDDGYNPPQALQLVRQMVEQDHVFAIFDSLGTPPNLVLRPYLNDNKVPQLYVATGATQFGADYAKYPWTIGWQANYHDEAAIFGKYLLKNAPNAKIGVLYQNDDFGQDLLSSLKATLGAKASQIVKAASYEVTDPDVTSPIASLKASGADTVFIFATPKAAIQAMVTIAKMGWKPQVYLTSVSASQAFMHAATGAGTAAATDGVISANYLKDASDPANANDKGIVLYNQILAKYPPAGVNAQDANCVYGMGVAFTMVDTLRMAGKSLTRDGVMHAANNLNELDNPFVYPGVKVTTTPTDRFPIREEVLVKYNAAGAWKPISGLITNRY